MKQWLGNHHDAIAGIPAQFMAHITNLSLADSSLGEDPEMFIAAAQSLIDKTYHLQHLKLLPQKKNISWMGMLAANAGKLR